MRGTAVNVAAVIAGSLLGGWLGRFIPNRMRQTVMVGPGVALLLIGLQLALKSSQPMIVIGSLILGGVLGELLRSRRAWSPLAPAAGAF